MLRLHGGESMDLGNLFFGFSGRLNRGKYWLAVVVFVVISAIMSALDLALGPDSISAALLNAIVGIVTFISGLAVGIKRLHDRDKSGWWLLVFYVVPGILITIALIIGIYGVATESMGNLGTATLLGLASLAIGVWAFVELGCLRGTVGPNRFGPDPLVVPAATPAE